MFAVGYTGELRRRGEGRLRSAFASVCRLQNKEIFVSEICHRGVCHLFVDTRAVSPPPHTPAGGGWGGCTSSPPLPAPPSRFIHLFVRKPPRGGSSSGLRPRPQEEHPHQLLGGGAAAPLRRLDVSQRVSQWTNTPPHTHPQRREGQKEPKLHKRISVSFESSLITGRTEAEAPGSDSLSSGLRISTTPAAEACVCLHVILICRL